MKLNFTVEIDDFDEQLEYVIIEQVALKFYERVFKIYSDRDTLEKKIEKHIIDKIDWEGWGTALKPSAEIWILCRKPLSEKTVAENVLKWGTGGINIDRCRIEGTYDNSGRNIRTENWHDESQVADKKAGMKTRADSNPQGRFPANVILDEEAGRLLDEQSGISKSKKSMRGVGYMDSNIYGTGDKNFDTEREYNDTGGASRFFKQVNYSEDEIEWVNRFMYCAKASKKERGEGNNHPTVKPLKLIKYLITLITPPSGICLDPFEGSGTHAVACKELKYNYIGFEINKEYCEIAENRIKELK